MCWEFSGWRFKEKIDVLPTSNEWNSLNLGKSLEFWLESQLESKAVYEPVDHLRLFTSTISQAFSLFPTSKSSWLHLKPSLHFPQPKKNFARVMNKLRTKKKQIFRSLPVFRKSISEKEILDIRRTANVARNLIYFQYQSTDYLFSSRSLHEWTQNVN
jgi:hypothetical protein